MATQTVTRAAESDSEPYGIYNVLADASNIPKWASAFADSIERVDDTHYSITKSNETFNLEVFTHPSAGAVDYIREMPNGKRGGAYIRVTPRPVGGSVITMTVPVGPDVSESDVAKVLERELFDLIQLAQR
ncbi:MAG TPA: hypothetical protein VIJ38_09985 [Acidobacteriaceae bacterium]